MACVVSTTRVWGFCWEMRKVSSKKTMECLEWGLFLAGLPDHLFPGPHYHFRGDFCICDAKNLLLPTVVGTKVPGHTAGDSKSSTFPLLDDLLFLMFSFCYCRFTYYLFLFN